MKNGARSRRSKKKKKKKIEMLLDKKEDGWIAFFKMGGCCCISEQAQLGTEGMGGEDLLLFFAFLCVFPLKPK
jgi:hypothetical protein